MKDTPMTFLEHLDELRKRIQRALLFFVVFSLIAYFYSGHLLKFLMLPAFSVRWVFLSPGEYFISTLKLSILSGFILSFPYILYQILAFISPGLTKKELRVLLPLTFLGTLLFFLALVVGYLWILPLTLHFFLVSGLPGTEASLSVGDYISFASTLFFWTGLVLQVPMLVIFLARAHLFSITQLKKFRSYSFLMSAVLAAILTPGQDLFLMMALTVLLYFFYELGIILAIMMEGRNGLGKNIQP